MRVEAPRDPWILCPRPNARARVRLFCFPYAGKGASVFRAWAHRMPAAVEVCAVQLPGREQRLREVPFTQMEALVEAAAEALRPRLDIPYAIFGHSMGALTGFECARELRRQGRPEPLHLMVAARQAPNLPERHGPIAHLPQREFIVAVQQRYDGIPAEVMQNPDLLDLLVPTLRADIQLLEAYAYVSEPPLNCPITCFGGVKDREATIEHLDGWCDHTVAEFHVRMFPGGHFFLQSAQVQVVESVAGMLAPTLVGVAPGEQGA